MIALNWLHIWPQHQCNMSMFIVNRKSFISFGAVADHDGAGNIEKHINPNHTFLIRLKSFENLLLLFVEFVRIAANEQVGNMMVIFGEAKVLIKRSSVMVYLFMEIFFVVFSEMADALPTEISHPLCCVFGVFAEDAQIRWCFLHLFLFFYNK